MNDDDMLAATRSSLTIVKNSLSDVRMNQSPEAIIRQANGRRTRRSLAAVGAGGLALGIGGLALSLSGSPVAPPAVHVNLAAWSVNTTSAGKVEVTIRQLKDPARLSHTLANAGVPVRFTLGRVCSPPSGDTAQLSRVVHKLPSDGDVMLTINPDAMPVGTELVIGIGHLRKGSHDVRAAAFGLVKTGTSLDCGPTPDKTGNG